MIKNNKINKQGLIISILIFIGLFSIYGLYLFSNKFTSNGKVDVAEKFLVDKKYNDLLITDIKVYRLNKHIHLNFIIENKGDTDVKEQSVKVVFLDKNGKSVEKSDIYITSLKVGETQNVDMLLTKELTKTDNFVLSAK